MIPHGDKSFHELCDDSIYGKALVNQRLPSIETAYEVAAAGEESVHGLMNKMMEES